MNTSIYGDFKIFISVPLNILLHFAIFLQNKASYIAKYLELNASNSLIICNNADVSLYFTLGFDGRNVSAWTEGAGRSTKSG